MMRPLLLSLAALFALAAPASAEDFTFTVPIRIENMTHAESVRVSCDVGRRSSDGTRNAIGSTGQIPVPLTAGRYVGTMTLRANAGPGYTAADANIYSCLLTYLWRMPDGTLFNRSLRFGERAGEYQRYTGQRVASTVDVVEGEITR